MISALFHVPGHTHYCSVFRDGKGSLCIAAALWVALGMPLRVQHLPSRHEALGSKPVEAWMATQPALASCLGNPAVAQGSHRRLGAPG